MTLPTPHPINEQTFSCSTNSIAGTPLAAVLRVSRPGHIVRLGAVSHGIFTTDCSIAVAVITAVAGGTAPTGGTTLSGSPMVLTAANSAAGTSVSMIPSAVTFVNEGDMIMFTPSGSTGTTIGGTFTAVIAPV